MIKLSGKFEERDLDAEWDSPRTRANEIYFTYTHDFRKLTPNERNMKFLLQLLIDQFELQGKKTKCQLVLGVFQIKYFAKGWGERFFKTVRLPISHDQLPLPKLAKRNGNYRVHFRGYYIETFDFTDNHYSYSDWYG
jgi:hypothetical protein